MRKTGWYIFLTKREKILRQTFVLFLGVFFPWGNTNLDLIRSVVLFFKKHKP